MISTWGPAISWASRASLLPGDEMVEQHADPALGAGSELVEHAARLSAPSRRSTTTPSMRRSSPHTFSISSASCTPSTRMRAAHVRRAPARRRRRGSPTRCAWSSETRARGEMGRWRGVAGRDGRDEPDRGAVDRERAGLVGEPAQQPGLPAQDHLVTVERDECRPGTPTRGAARGARRPPRPEGTTRPSVRARRAARRGSRCGAAARTAWCPTVRGHGRARRHGYCVRR